MANWKETACYRQLKAELKRTFRLNYSRGNAQYKEDYTNLFYTILTFGTTATFDNRSEEYLRKLFLDCINDNPLLFYVEAFSWHSTGSSITVDYNYNWKECLPIYKKIFDKLKFARQSCAGKSESEKVDFVHEYIIRNTEYLLTSKYPVHYGHSSFIYGKAVCDGISKSSKILMDAVGVSSIVVSGDSVGEPHAWNINFCRFAFFSRGMSVGS